MNHKPRFIFFLSDGDLYAFHLKTQKYYHVSQEYFDKIQILSRKGAACFERHDLEELKSLGFEESSLDISWDGDTPSHIAHQASRINTFKPLSKEDFVKEYTAVSQAAYALPEKQYPDGPIVTLPQPTLDDLGTLSLKDCFLSRKTCREFYPYEMSLKHLSTILFACFGPIHGSQRKDLEKLALLSVGMRRSSPSATGLCGCSAIVWVNKAGIEPGLYFYQEQHHALVKLPQSLTPDDLCYAVIDQFWARNLAAGIFIINDLQMTWVKDKTCRGYLASHQEAGHISQNILLSATALKLHTWISGSFRDDYLNKKLCLEDHQFVSLFIGFGKGSNEPVSKEYLDVMNRLEGSQAH